MDIIEKENYKVVVLFDQIYTILYFGFCCIYLQLVSYFFVVFLSNRLLCFSFLWLLIYFFFSLFLTDFFFCLWIFADLFFFFFLFNNNARTCLSTANLTHVHDKNIYLILFFRLFENEILRSYRGDFFMLIVSVGYILLLLNNARMY